MQRSQASVTGGLLVELDSTWAFVRETPQDDWTDGEIHSPLVQVGDQFVATPALDAVVGSTLYLYGPDLAKLASLTSTGFPRYSGIVRLR